MMIYYENALKAVGQMEKSSGKYTEKQTDGRYSSIFSAIGNFYNIQGDFHKAMNYYSKALKLFEKHGWTLAAANAYYNIGELYLSMENYGQAEINYNRTHALAAEENDSFIRNRVTSFGGIINIDSKTGEGTEINIEFRVEKGELRVKN
ncbi:hypothetical protein FACS189413_15240 [Bacteroidia bacterium]|nr:hypothetical protein FACS189413_15240 [Bacteroidia bacterium]